MTDYGNWFDESLGDQPVTLGDAARARRDAIREELQRRVVVRRRGRAALRASFATLLVAFCAWFAWPSDPESPGNDHSRPDLVADARPFVMQHADFAVVANTDDVLARYAAPRRPLPAEIFLSDDQLIEGLRAIDRPATLLRTGDRVEVYPDVADPLSE